MKGDGDVDGWIKAIKARADYEKSPVGLAELAVKAEEDRKQWEEQCARDADREREYAKELAEYRRQKAEIRAAKKAQAEAALLYCDWQPFRDKR